MEIGIYKITCNNKCYIGSSINIRKRWRRHINDLNGNKHINIHLQRAFDKYGINNFKFEILELCEIDQLLIREQYFIDEFQPFNDNGFNIGKNASGGDNLTNNPNREDIIKRIKETLNYKISNMSKEEKVEKWGKFGESNPNYGKRWNDEMRENASLRRIGTEPINKGKTNIELYGLERANIISDKLSKNASERIGDKNHFYGKKHSEESKDKIRQKRIGKKPINRIRLSVDGIIYESYHDASKELGLPVVTIRWRCLSDNPRFIDYILI